MNKAYIIGIVIIATAMGFTMWSFKDQMTPYVNIEQARHSDRTVQVRGKIMHETAHYDPEQHALRFNLKDDTGKQIEVVYHGPKPDAFDAAPETAATGTMSKDSAGKEIFVSDSMVVKCPSKYDDRKTPYKKAGAAGGTS